MFRRLALATLLAFSASSLYPQASQSNDASLTGHWNADVNYLGTHLYNGFDLDQQGEKLTGKLSGDALAGSIEGSSFHFLVKDNDGGTKQVNLPCKSPELYAEYL